MANTKGAGGHLSSYFFCISLGFRKFTRVNFQARQGSLQLLSVLLLL